jgi:hypothetical protein
MENLLKNINDLLFNPDLFFNEKLKNEVSLKYPLLIMLVNYVFGIGLFFLLMYQAGGFLPSHANSIMYIIILFAAIVALIAMFVFWVVLTGVFYLISSAFNSEGSFRRTLEFVGYGFVPQIFSSMIAFLVMCILISSLNVSAQNPQLFAESVKQTLLNNPLSLVSKIFGILCLLWSANIWRFGLLHARKMSIKNANLTVCIPVALYLVYLVINVYFQYGGRH